VTTGFQQQEFWAIPTFGFV